MWGEESTILKLIVPEISIFAYQKLILGTPVSDQAYRMIMYKFLCGGKNTNITSYIYQKLASRNRNAVDQSTMACINSGMVIKRTC